MSDAGSPPDQTCPVKKTNMIQRLRHRAILLCCLAVIVLFLPSGLFGESGEASPVKVQPIVVEGIPFNVTVDFAGLRAEDRFAPVDRSETLRISKATYDDLAVVITLQVKPGGPPRA